MKMEVSPFVIGHGVLQGFVYVVVFLFLLFIVFCALTLSNPTIRATIGF